MALNDEHVFVCEDKCIAEARQSKDFFGNMITMPENLWQTKTFLFKQKSVFPVEYILSQLKFYYGLVYEVRRLDGLGARMPFWFLMKDDDTFVHVPNLIKAIDISSPGGMLQRDKLVSFGDTSCIGICGGEGWLLSGVLAAELVRKHGQRMLDYQLEKAQYSQQYDVVVPRVVGWVTGAKLHNLPELENANLFLCNGKPGKKICGGPCYPGKDLDRIRADPKKKCFNQTNCLCTRSAYPATWHLRDGDWKRALELLKVDRVMR